MKDSMKDLKITDVRALPGDSAFLIDDGKTAILCDSGFAFTGERVAENVAQVLGDRPLDYIFLTHSHYDHVLGATYVKRRYPNACVVAGAYAAKIFAKESARALMRDLDRKYADALGVGAYEDLIDTLTVDLAVEDGDEIVAGEMHFLAVSLMGHTKCSMGYYLADRRFLIGTESLGLYDGETAIFPCCLVSYQMAQEAMEKARGLEVEHLLLPHFGVLSEEKTAYYLTHNSSACAEIVEAFARILREGGSEADVIRYFEETFYHGAIKRAYPRDAMVLNTSIMAKVIGRELVAPQESL